MSGHSKWATTKRQKAVVDAKRGALFTKIGNQIAIAARSGTDPNMNPSLAMVLEKARLANMPKANIERAIARVADKSASVSSCARRMSARLSIGLNSLHNALAGAELAFSVSFSMILLNSTICKTLSFMEIVILPVH